VHEEDQARIVSGRDEAGRAVAGVVCADRSALSQGGQWAAAGGVEPMVRIYFLQQCFNRSDPGVEEAL